MGLRCRLLGHRYRFTADDATLNWRCEREGCAVAGSKRYESAAKAERFAAAFDREDRDEIGRRAPLLGLLPLRVWYRLKHGRQRASPPDRQ